MRRIEVLLDTLVEHLARELAQSQFVTAACELRVDESPEGVRPIRIELASGGSIQVGGIIDRLDVYSQEDVTYFRVVDYKTGSQSYVLEDVCEGLGLQMLLYLFARGGKRRTSFWSQSSSGWRSLHAGQTGQHGSRRS